ncbi:hypothetical protein [Pediococcus cellicola]|uniref:hypothetical protein n=1 Tax=Pediococcus cellicola TaxID=319652 RepID=UPI0007110555|nr:hypothetical protein [Pediococcus cellicola]GEL15337.1 hypothetical protein PCE01_11390 [Pediococcus cellicola]
MINLKTKGGQKILAAGNWAWSLFTINFAWFLINFSVILTLIVLGSFELNVGFIMINLILVVMLTIFTVPSLMATFRTVEDWQVNGSGSFFKEEIMNWVQMLRNVKLNLSFAGGLGLLIFFNKLSFGLVLPHMFVLTSSIILLAMLLITSFKVGTEATQSFTELCLDFPVKIIVATVILITLLILNLVLQLAFLIVICSVSLSVFIAYRMFGGRVEKND